MKNLQKLTQVARGLEQPDLVLKNANIVNVFTGEITPGDVAICQGYIAGVGSYEGPCQVDYTDHFICPGFIDAHIHIESTMVQPAEFVRLALPSGTTSIVADPHEIVSVCGPKGMQYMLDATEDIPCNVFMMLPSSIPSTRFETAGGTFTAKEMQAFLSHKRVLGLGEAMNAGDVIGYQGEMANLLPLFSQRTIDGHAPGLRGHSLQAYAAAGVATEHECTTFSEALEKARAGLAILVREGSAAHNLTTLVRGILDNDIPTQRFMFCTDDKHLSDLQRDGHIRWNVKMAIDMGMKPVQAIQMATWNTAQVYGLRDLGAVAPGYKADLVVLSSLKNVQVAQVYKDGVPAAQRLEEMRPFTTADPDILKTIRAKHIAEKDIQLAVGKTCPVIEMVPYQLVTNHLEEEVPQENGYFIPNGEYSKLCVVERHGKNGNIAVAPLKGYGICQGAIATSVAHDSHNIIAAGDNDRDIVLAVNHLKEMDGGYVLVKEGKILGQVPLAIAGLMSTGEGNQVQAEIGKVLELALEMGVPYYFDPFISLSFLALPVIPSLRLTDMGVFDVDRFELIEK